MVCYTLRRIFDKILKRGEIILEDATVEETPFPHHKETIMTIIVEPGENGVLIEEIGEKKETPNEPTV